MAIPKKIKKDIQLIPDKILMDRREELLEYIQEDGTFLPKSVLHADLDRGMLDFVRDELEVYAEGKKVNPIDIITTTQNWSQFTETWNFQDLDNNIKPPFIATVRQPDVKYGSNPSLQYTIPNRKQFYYAKVPTWDGERKGMDIYKIPQPVPVDITYNVKLFCTKMRHLNEFNKIVMQKFTSRQAYTFVKGHYIPIILNNVSDESVLEIEKRKYFIQNYEFLMMGFLIDEKEFEVSPAITRSLALFELNNNNPFSQSNRVEQPNPDRFDLTLNFNVGVNELSELYPYKINFLVGPSENVRDYTVFINGNIIGYDLEKIEINSNDLVKISVTKYDDEKESTLKVNCILL
jgi:hypothetical protein